MLGVAGEVSGTAFAAPLRAVPGEGTARHAHAGGAEYGSAVFAAVTGECGPAHVESREEVTFYGGIVA